MNVNSPNIEIKQVTIFRPSTASTEGDTEGQFTKFIIWPGPSEKPEDNYVLLDEIVLNEDMFSGSVYGSLTFVDSINFIDQFNFTTNEWLRLQFDNYPAYDFRISEIKIESNVAQKTTQGPYGPPVKVILNFISDEFVNRNFDVVIDDFIGKISKKGGDADLGTIQSTRQDTVLPPYSNTITIPQNLRGKEKGFVQYLMSLASTKSLKKLAAHETFNDVWIKHSFNFYPYQKDANNLRITQLMNYICEYACYKTNENAVNFFFWEDLDRWNFKCIEGLIEEQKTNIDKFKKNDEEPTLYMFKPHLDPLNTKAMFSMEILNDFNQNYLLDSGIAFSTYDRVKPNWANPYRGFVDINQSFITKTINYNYTLDLGNWYDISGKKTKTEKTSIFKKNITFINDDTGIPKYVKNDKTGEFELDPLSLGDPASSPHGYTGDKLLAFNNYSFNAIVDNIFGFYSPPYNTNHVSSWQMKSFKHTTEKEYWQSQFNFCELPGAILLLIHGKNGIKDTARKAAISYADLKNKKTTWDVYKKKMCCERSVPSNFFAVLVGAEKIHGSTGSGAYSTQDPGGIWGYSWVEVEMWPQEKTKQRELELKTTTYDQDDEGNTVTDVTTEKQTIEPKNNITEMLKLGYQIIKFDESGTDFPFVFAVPPWALMGYAPQTYKKNVIIAGGGDGPSKNKIKEVEITTKNNRAFNLNEILNSRIPSEFEAGAVENNNNATIIMNPGVSTILTNTPDDPNIAEKTAYPIKTQMLPVGKFRVISNKCPNFIDAGQFTSVAGNGFYHAGRIVQMSAVPKETLQTIILNGVNDAAVRAYAAPESEKITEDLYDVNEDGSQGGFIGTQEVPNPNYKPAVDKDYMFLFDTENAHDGFCADCNS